MSPNNLRVLCFVGAALFTFADSAQAQDKLPGVKGVKYSTVSSTGKYKAVLEVKEGGDGKDTVFEYNFSRTIGSAKYKWNDQLNGYEPQNANWQFHYIKFEKISPGIYKYFIINSVTGYHHETGSCVLQL